MSEQLTHEDQEWLRHHQQLAEHACTDDPCMCWITFEDVGIGPAGVLFTVAVGLISLGLIATVVWTVLWAVTA